MKHTAVILLLSLLLLQTGGYYVILSIDILEAKQEAMNVINNDKQETQNITKLSFPVKDGKVIAQGLIFNDEDEFTYQGKMYDVISTEKSKGYITFKCYTDNKETELTANLNNKIDSDKDTPAQKHKGGILLKTVIPYTPVSKQQFFFSTHISSAYYAFYCNRLQPFIYKAIVSPPPEFVLA